MEDRRIAAFSHLANIRRPGLTHLVEDPTGKVVEIVKGNKKLDIRVVDHYLHTLCKQLVYFIYLIKYVHAL